MITERRTKWVKKGPVWLTFHVLRSYRRSFYSFLVSLTPLLLVTLVIRLTSRSSFTRRGSSFSPFSRHGRTPALSTLRPAPFPSCYPTPSAPLTHTGAGERAPGRYTLHNIRPVGATLTRPFAGPPAEPGHERRFVLRSSSLPPLPVSFTSFGSRLGATLRYAPPRSPPSAVGDRPAARRNE